MGDDKKAAEALKAQWDAKAAEAAAKKAVREEAEASTPAAKARREATAERDAATARREQVAALTPDLGSADRGELTVSGDEPLGGTPAAGLALRRTAEKIAGRVVEVTGADEWSLLVTSDADLAGSDAAHYAVKTDLEALQKWAEAVLTATQHSEAEPTTRAFLAPPVAGALAGLIPGVVGLLSARRTVTGVTATLDDSAAVAAVAGELKGGNEKRHVFLDAIRTLPGGGEISTLIDSIINLRQELIERKIELEAAHDDDDAEGSDTATAIALVAKVSDSIGELIAELRTVPEGATRSPLAAAVLREGLHDGAFRYVLHIKAQATSGTQLVDDKPFWLRDRFAVLAAATIAWSLIDVPSGELLGSGVDTGTAQVKGKIGSELEPTADYASERA